MQVSSKKTSTVVRFSLLLAALACGGDSDGDGGAGALCTTFSACGGDLAGTTWLSQDLCLPDDFADSLFQELPAECDGAIVLEDATSNTTLTFGADGTFTETGAATVQWAMSFSQACITAAAGQPADELLIGLFCDQVEGALAEGDGTMSPAVVTCDVVDNACNCDAVQENPVDATGPFTIEGTQVVYPDVGLRQDFCAQGDRLQVASIEGSQIDAHVVYTRAP